MKLDLTSRPSELVKLIMKDANIKKTRLSQSSQKLIQVLLEFMSGLLYKTIIFFLSFFLSFSCLYVIFPVLLLFSDSSSLLCLVCCMRQLFSFFFLSFFFLSLCYFFTVSFFLWFFLLVFLWFFLLAFLFFCLFLSFVCSWIQNSFKQMSRIINLAYN